VGTAGFIDGPANLIDVSKGLGSFFSTLKLGIDSFAEKDDNFSAYLNVFQSLASGLESLQRLESQSRFIQIHWGICFFHGILEGFSRGSVPAGSLHPWIGFNLGQGERSLLFPPESPDGFQQRCSLVGEGPESSTSAGWHHGDEVLGTNPLFNKLLGKLSDPLASRCGSVQVV
jgi:hypothetical protein